MKGGVRFLEKSVQIVENIMAFYGTKGQKSEGEEEEMEFIKILEIINIQTGQFIMSKKLDI